jgi:hypothetical protein
MHMPIKKASLTRKEDLYKKTFMSAGFLSIRLRLRSNL